ncbi:MAG TPA: LptF/LptG family permease [Rhizomicrobium sp.]|nr:LptF/LptG family permease [Rhizomicrobium sp.]
MIARARHGGRPIYLTPFGLHTRYMLGIYLRHTLMVTAALMTIALTIDLWPQIQILGDDPRYSGLLPWHVVRLAALRLPDLLPPFLPFATFLGVVWSESALTESRERMLIWNSGRSPLFCLVPAVLAGLLMGVGMFFIDGVLRPAAIHRQMAEVLGREGIRLDRGKSGGNHWIALPDGVLRAQIEYGPPLKLRNVVIYKLDRDGHLAELNSAALATPLSTRSWRLQDGRYWRADAQNRGDVISSRGTNTEAEIPFRERIVSMSLNEMWLRNLGLSPQYLYLGELGALSKAEIVSRDASGYRTRRQALFSGPLFTCAMAMLGASLAMLFFAYQARWLPLVGVLLAGYLSHFASKALYLMGEFGYIPAVVAGWLAPLLVIGAVAGTLHVIQKTRGLGLRLQETPQFAEAD